MGRGKAIIALAASAGLLLGSGAGVSVTDTITSASVITGTESSGETCGVGTIEGYIDKDVMKVVLPSVDINYIIDPLGSIKATGAAAHKGAVFDYTLNGTEKNDGFVFFQKKEGSKLLYSSSIDLSVQNKSSYPVKVKVDASYTKGTSGIALSDVSDYNEADPSISFKLQSNEESSALVGSKSFEKTLQGIPEAYSLTYTKTGYSFDLAQNIPDNVVIPEYTVELTGECNPSGDWGNTVPSASLVTVTWYITKDFTERTNNPSVKNVSVSVDNRKNTDVVLNLENMEGYSVSSVSYSTGAKSVLLKENEYSVNGNVLTISAASFKTLKTGSYTYKVTFNNNSTDSVQINIK
jgi:hypothetical protein